MYKINIVEDEKDLNDIVKNYLERDGITVSSFQTGQQALRHVSDDVHLWLLDIMLSDEISGYDILKEIRKVNDSMPVIFMSARDQEIDRIIGLELGSDDYITKPFSPRELVLRVKNVLKRTYNNIDYKHLSYGDYRIEKEERNVYLNDELVVLTSKEMDLLILLVENKNQAFSRDQILELIWDENYYGSDRVVDDLMRRLRKKMPILDIETIYGYGYRLK